MAKKRSRPASKSKSGRPIPVKLETSSKASPKTPKAGYRHRRQAKKQQAQQAKAAHRAALPDDFWARTWARLHPNNIARCWFSRRSLIRLLKLSLVSIVVLAVAGVVTYNYYRQNLPDSIGSLQACIHGQTTEYYDSSGQTLLWASKSNIDCLPVALDSVSDYLIQAVLAAEDKDFYQHSGFRGSSILRAALNNLRGNDLQGGSTITQQYIKTAILKSSERVVSRKIKELILAVELERTFTKDEIMTAYLNVIPFGSIYDGIEAAARGYFDKPAADLSLDEAALLVAALPGPGYYWQQPELHQQRRNHVLGLMRDQGRINQAEYQQAMASDSLAKVIRTHDQYEDLIAPHFVLEVEKRLKDQYGFGQDVRRAGLRVITTIDLEAQAAIEKAVTDSLAGVDQRGFDNAAAVAVDVQTGKVIAQQGSRDFNHPDYGQTNTVTNPHPTGSTFKIFDYGALFEDSTDWGPGSILYDYKTTFAPGYSPPNYSGTHTGPITIRRALGLSLNIPAIKAMYIAGIDNVHEFARLAGIRTPPNCGGYCGLATAIGGGNDLRLDELANAYASFSRGGQYLELTYIDKIYSPDGQLLHRWQAEPERVFSEQTAYLLNHILADTGARFSPTLFNVPGGVTAAIKTGTTDYFKDNLIVGYSKTVAMAYWFGHHDRAQRFFGEPYTTPVKAGAFRSFMGAYHQGLPSAETGRWQAPAGIKRVQIDLITGRQTADTDPDKSRSDIFPSWYIPKRTSDENEVAEIDTVSGKRATECTPLRARMEVEGQAILPELAVTDPYYNTWINPIIEKLGTVVGADIPIEEDDVHDCDDLPPTIQAVSVPAVCRASCNITVSVSAGSFDLDRVNFLIDGQLLPSGSIATSGGLVSYSYQPNFSADRQLVVEVLDQGLYQAQLTVEMEFEAVNPLILSSIEALDSNYQLLRVSWNRALPALRLVFGGDCSTVEPIVMPAGSQSTLISSQGLLEADCSASLIGQGIASNSLDFGLYKPDIDELEEQD